MTRHYQYQWKLSLFVLLLLGIIGTFFGIKTFSSSVSLQEPLPVQHTQLFSQLAASFTSTKTWMLIPPSEILIASDLTATVQALHFTTGEQVRGGQPVLMLFDRGGKYASQLETAQLTLDVVQSLYDTTKATVTQQLQQAEFDMASLQQQLQQAEYDLQALLVNSHKQDNWVLWEEESETEEELERWMIGESWVEAALWISEKKEMLVASLYSLETQLENAKLHYELLKTTSSSELDQLSSRLQNVRKEYETLYTMYNNLSVRAPVAGTLGKLFVIPGEEVSVGTPLFTLIPHLQTPVIKVELTFEEYLTVLPLSEVLIIATSSGESYTSTWKISTRSPLANENGMYLLTIESFDSLPRGQTAFQVYFPIRTDFFYLPKEVVVRGNQEKNIDNSGDENYLYLLIDNEVQPFPVQLWNQRDHFVEIKTPFHPDAQILTFSPF